MKGIFLLLGSNVGDRKENFEKAIGILEANETTIVDYSSVYETAPWGNPDQPWFYNMVVRIDTIHSPQELLEICQNTEKQLGRKRIEKWGSREIDIDILYYDNLAENTENLQLPHPGIAIRRFTLLPLVEIIPNESHPILQLTQTQLLDICPDELACRKIKLDLNI